MQRLDSNVEEQMIEKAIEEETTWDKLPKRIKLYVNNNSDEWSKKIKEYCIKKRLRWSDCLARTTCKEHEYYEELMRYLRRTSALFPYHLSDYVCRILRVSPFRHYCEVLFEALRDERPYDSISNFSAADALRVTGIGRNEYIDIMNKCRAKKIMWKINKSFAKDLLPNQPGDICIEAWWIVNIVNLSQEEIRKLSEQESMVVDRIYQDEVEQFGEHDPAVIRSLYSRGLAFFDVPVFPDDHFQVSTLEGFVSNRDQSYEDPIEELLYAVFVTSSEHATVAELASTLQADLAQLEAAVSLAARLGWAKKVVDPEALLYEPNTPGSPLSDGCNAEFCSSPKQSSGDETQGETSSSRDSKLQRFAFLVDSNLISYIMMGSMSPGLKQHAVTLYEAGKLGDSSVMEMCEDLQKVEGTELEGELQHFANHAFNLRHVLECLKCSSSEHLSAEEEGTKIRVDVVRCGSLSGLTPATIQRVFRRDYDVIVSMAPLPSLPAVISPHGDGPVHFGLPSRSAITPWMKLLLYTVGESGPISVALIRGQRLRHLPPSLAGCYKALVWTWDGNGIGGSGGNYEELVVDGRVLLHVLNSLLRFSALLVQPYAKQSFHGKSVLTMDVALPLRQSCPSLKHAAEELHLHTMGYIRLVSVTGKKESSTGCSEDVASEAGDTGILEAGDTEAGDPHTGMSETVNQKTEKRENEEQRTWVPLSVEFGVPLFDRELCKLVCEGVSDCKLFELSSLEEHRQAMASLQAKLQDLISDYRANGPISRLAYLGVKSSLTPSNSFIVSGASSSVPSIDGRAYCLSGGEDQFSPSPKDPIKIFLDADADADADEIPLPGVNLIFNGSWLAPLDISSCLQGKLPASLLA